jgi:FkbM family methyltransferase
MDYLRKRFRLIRRIIIRWWRIHTIVSRLLRYHPYTGFIGRRLLQYIPFLLPHDKSYYGFVHLVHEGDGLFLDVGANDGISAIGFRHIHSDYRILSIEPNLCHEAHLKKLKKRLKRFDYLLVGAGREHLKMTLYIPVFNSVPIYTAASLKKDHALRTMNEQHLSIGDKNIVILEHTVDILPLDELNLNPDVIKIDTEGYDFEVLLGMKATIERCRPVILIEYIMGAYPLIKDFFDHYRYTLWTYDHDGDMFYAFNEKQERDFYLHQKVTRNLFCVPMEKFPDLPVSGEK